MRLHRVAPEFEGRVRLVERAFPLEVFGGGPPDRQELELEIWLAALQEPEAIFKPFSDEWPTTTLPAFEAAWCAAQQGATVGRDFDLRIRRAFFAEGRNIGRREVMIDLAHEAGLDMKHFTHRFNNGQALAAILAEGKLGKEHFGVRGTPTLMLSDGTRLRHPMAFPKIKDGKILSVGRMSCYGESCYDATRQFFIRALQKE